jgi:hypothetical protein
MAGDQKRNRVTNLFCCCAAHEQWGLQQILPIVGVASPVNPIPYLALTLPSD